MTTLLPRLEINSAVPPVGTVIWLHGLGADGHDFASIVPELQLPETLPLRFIFPHAPAIPVTINSGYVMPAWYDIRSLTREDHADQTGIDQSVKEIQSLIQHEETHGMPAEKIILAGFSQGAAIALTTGLTYPKRLAGILALSGYFPQGENVFKDAAPVNQNLPIFLGHGTEDTIVPYALGEMVYHLLQEHHYSVDWHKYRMAHSVCGEEIADVARWLENRFRST